MPDSLPELEAERSKILRQFSTLGDLRVRHGSGLLFPQRSGSRAASDWADDHRPRAASPL